MNEKDVKYLESGVKKQLRTFQRELADKTTYNNMLWDVTEDRVFKEDKDIIEFRANQIVALLKPKEKHEDIQS